MRVETTDRIEKQILLKAPRTRVWKALTDIQQFQAWFTASLTGELAPGKRARGNVTHPGFEHVRLDIEVERMEPEHFFSYRWHPFAVDPKREYPAVERTLVEFTLVEVAGGTRLTVVESGFDRVAADRRAETVSMHEPGWVEELQLLAAFVTK
jgi:uncharacterized protein YndB with AHSA1/START domain